MKLSEDYGKHTKWHDPDNSAANEARKQIAAERDQLRKHAQRLANGLRPFIEKQSGLTTAQEVISAFNALAEWDASNLNTVASDTATN
jgi:hypothetical protein